MSLQKDIMQAVADIVQVEGKSTFTEEDLKNTMQTDPNRWEKNYAAVFHTMHTAPTQAGTIVDHEHQNIFEKLDDGRYQLTEKGKLMVQQAME